VIHEKQFRLDNPQDAHRTLRAVHGNTKEGRHGLMVLIKPGEGAVNGDIIDMMDEALINDVKKYAVLKPNDEAIK